MSLLAQIAAQVGEKNLFAADAVEPRYLEEETRGQAGRPAGLVCPKSTADVAAVLSLCHAAGQPVVVQGGRTGMTRATLPRDGELILSLERMNGVESIDPIAGTMVVGAGCVLQVAQEAAEAAGWRLAVDIGARGSCTIGGMIATNAGGHQVLRFGMMREQVLGLEAVLADGTILSAMKGLIKNNTGYDLKHLIVGSEGTIAIITRAVLRLRAQPTKRETALCGFSTYDNVAQTLGRLEALLPGQVTAFELMWSGFLDAACDLLGHAYPFEQHQAFAVLIETEGSGTGAWEAALATCLEEGLMDDAVLAQSERDHQRLWSLREAIGPLVERMTLVEPFDVSAPLPLIGDVADRVGQRLIAQIPGARPLFFGHIADGNLHLALEISAEDQRQTVEAIVYDAIRDVDGSISAEHGIGMLKRKWLSHSRSPEEIATMRLIRTALDPKQILNPERIF